MASSAPSHGLRTASPMERITRRLCGGVQRVDLHETRFPDKTFVRVADTSAVDVDAKVGAVVAGVLLTELVQHVGGVEPSCRTTVWE